MDLADVLTTIPLPATIVLALASLAFLCFFVITTTKSNKDGASPPPPPPQASGSWPIIGHLHLLGGPRPPHRVLGQMADQHGPIFTIRMGVHPALVVSSWEIAKECLTTHDRIFADRPATLAMDILGYHRSMFGFSPYGSFWRETRKMATLELLSSHRLDLLQHVREKEVQTATKELYAYWQAANKEQGQSHSENLKLEGRNGGVSVEMSSWFGEISLNVILRMIAGKSVGYLTGGADSVKLSKLLKEFFELTGRFVVADGLPYLRWLDVGGFEKAMRKTAGEMDVVVEGWLREHKAKRDSGEAAETEKDFMDVILDAVGDRQDIDGRDSATFNKATSL
ncbi:unnamed protein product [Linum trigynum]|uniref:Cytochrome P450 n=1 Tax=Linum trigynum TaxID=586398 RepID=A0AAV2GL10_9ROSI